MRLFIPAAASLLIAGCATTPQKPEPVQPTPVTPSEHVHSSLLGMTASELVAHLGNPALQVREGAGLKMQFRSRYCVLDAYLYPPTDSSGPERVAHVDARLRSGLETDPRICVAGMSRA